MNVGSLGLTMAQWQLVFQALSMDDMQLMDKSQLSHPYSIAECTVIDSYK